MKYNIDKSFGIFRYFKVPFNGLIFKLAKILNVLPKHLKNKKLTVKKIKIDKTTNYLLIPKTSQKLPCLIYFPGGGFIFPAAPYHYKNIKEYSLKANICVFMINYKTNKPLSYILNETNKILNVFLNNLDSYNINKDMLYLGGDSAGGLLALNYIDNKFKKLLLIYPVVDKQTTPSKLKYTDTPMWNSKINSKMWNKILDICFLSPIDTFNYDKYPLTYIETCEFDPLHDEAIILANKLKDKVIINNTKGTMHGYDIVRNSKITKESLITRIEFLKK